MVQGGGRRSPPDPGTRRAQAIFRRARPLTALPTLAAGLLAALCGPVLCGLLVWRGAREGRIGWIILGAICGLPWLLLVIVALRRRRRRHQA